MDSKNPLSRLRGFLSSSQRSSNDFAASDRIILAILEDKHVAGQAELMQATGCSQQALSERLVRLEELGLLQRNSRGGAIATRHEGERPFEERDLTDRFLKEAIGRKAVETFVEDGSTIFMDGSTTCMSMLPYMKSRHLTVTTNCPLLAIKAKELNLEIRILIAGGEYRYMSESLTGKATLNFISSRTFDATFLGALTISSEGAATEAYSEEAEIKRIAAKRAKKTIIMVDETKFAKSSLIKFARPTDYQYLLTNEGANPEIIRRIKSKGIKVTLV